MTAELIATVLLGAIVIALLLLQRRRTGALSRKLTRGQRQQRKAATEATQRYKELTSAQRRQAAATAEVRRQMRVLRLTTVEQQATMRELRAEVARQKKVLDELPATVRSLTARELGYAVSRIRAGALDDVAQTEAFLQILRLTEVTEALPRTRGYPVSPDAMLVLVDLIRRDRPSLYVEFGSGTSTVVAAAAARAAGLDMRVIAVDHEEVYADATRELAARHGLADRVDVRLAPLTPVDGMDGYRWYDQAALADLTDIDLCFVDGPPGITNPKARFPVIGFLDGRLSGRATVVLDDVDREDELAVVEEWSTRPEVRAVHRPAAEKGIAIIEIAGA